MTQLYPPTTAADITHAKAFAAKRLRSNGVRGPLARSIQRNRTSPKLTSGPEWLSVGTYPTAISKKRPQSPQLARKG